MSDARRLFHKGTLKSLNAQLQAYNLQIVDPAEAQDERARLEAFEAAGGLDRPAYALSPGMDGFDIAPLVAMANTFSDGLAMLSTPGAAQGYDPGNGYFVLADAAPLYLLVRALQPRRIIEVGCGNSTRVARAALVANGGTTTLTAIDPWPRADIDGLFDRFEQGRVEEVDAALFDTLESGDILFIDSSHQLRMSNDVAHLFCRIIPALKPGVVIHVHDVFLPYEYPKRFFYDCPSWGEQYMLHALLQGGGYEILWPGYHLQRSRPDAVAALPFLSEGRAQSFWMRKR